MSDKLNELNRQLDQACTDFDKHYDTCIICDNEGTGYCGTGKYLEEEIESLIRTIRVQSEQERTAVSAFGQSLSDALKKKKEK